MKSDMAMKSMKELAAEIAATTKRVRDRLAEEKSEKERADREEKQSRDAEQQRISRVATIALKYLNELRDALEELGVEASVAPAHRWMGTKGVRIESRSESMGEIAGITFDSAVGDELRSCSLMFLRGRSTRDPAVSAVFVGVMRDARQEQEPVILEELDLSQEVSEESIQLSVQRAKEALDAEGTGLQGSSDR